MIDTSLKLAAACPFPQTYSPNFRDEPVFLPFLYDDAAAKIREENNRFLGGNVKRYNQ